MCITKTLSLLVNGVLLASGAALFITAIVINEISLKFLDTETVDLDWIVTVLTIAGAIAAAAAVSGLVGACCCEIKVLLYLSFGLIVGVFIMEVVFVINSSVATEDDFNNYMDKNAREHLAQYGSVPTSTEEWDRFQSHGECCGYVGPTDWGNSGLAIPKTCCKNKGICDTTIATNIFTVGCGDTLKYEFSDSINILKDTTYAMMFVHVAAGAFGLIMILKALACGCCCCI